MCSTQWWLSLPPDTHSLGAADRPGTGSQCILALVHWCQEISAGVLTCFKADIPLPRGPETPLGYTGKSLNCKTYRSAWGIFKMNSQTTPDPGGGITCCDYPTKDGKKRKELKTIQDPCLIAVLPLTVKFPEKYSGTQSCLLPPATLNALQTTNNSNTKWVITYFKVKSDKNFKKNEDEKVFRDILEKKRQKWCLGVDFYRTSPGSLCRPQPETRQSFDYAVKDWYLASSYKWILWLSQLLHNTKANLLPKSLGLINKK